MKIKNMVISILGLTMIMQSVALANASSVENKEDVLSRVYGSDRYATNIATVNASFSEYSQVAVGSNFNDLQTVKAINQSIDKSIPFILSPNQGSGLSNIKKINSNSVESINLNSPTNLSNAVIVNHMSDLITALTYVTKNKAEIIFNDGRSLPDMSKYSKVLIVGGVVKNYKGYEQIAGKDRYETNRLVNAKYGIGRGYLVSGENTADAISAVNMVMSNPIDIILTKNDGSSVDINNTNVEGIIGGAVKVQRKILYVNPHQDDEILTMGLSLLRDVSTNKNNTYLMLLTDGAKTSSIKAINKRLEKEGKSKITPREITISRNKEMIDCFVRIGGDNKNVLINPYKNLELTNENVYNEINKFYEKYKNIELKTMAVDAYDKSAGAIDHRACRDGSLNFGRDKKVKVTLLSEGGGTLMNVNNSEKNKIRYAAEAYEVYNPAQNRYAVGYTSVPDAFNKFKNNIFIFGVINN